MNGLIVFRGQMEDGSEAEVIKVEDGSWRVRLDYDDHITVYAWRKEEKHEKPTGIFRRLWPSKSQSAIHSSR